VRVLEDWLMPGSGIYAVYPSNRMVTTRHRAWVDHLARYLRMALTG
jgi:DNA-binding transcriptional LysR family regulator